MAGIKNLVRFAAKFLNMAKSKAKDKKKPTVKKKSAKPVAKSKSKPIAKKAAPKAKKVAKPVKKVKPAAKKKVVAKAKVKAVKKIAKAKPIAKKKIVAKAKVKVSKKTVKKVKAVKPPKAKKVKKAPKPAKVHVKEIRREAPQPVKKQLYISEAKKKQKPAGKKFRATINMDLRYSDKELLEFKNLIDKKLVTAREELKYLKEALENHNDNQAGSKAWNMEEGSDTSEMETLMNQISRQHQYIRNLELALVRIENKTYGICRLTGKLIPKERLRIVPHATLSLEAKMNRKAEEEVSPAATIAVTPPSDFAEGFED